MMCVLSFFLHKSAEAQRVEVAVKSEQDDK